MSFTAYNPEDVVISSDAVVAPMWSGNVTTLTTFYTSSTQETSTPGKFYLDTYQTASADSSAAVQFSIAYGHVSGSGSAYFNPAVTDRTPTRDIYGQFRTLLYGDENAAFTFGGSAYSSKDIAVISVERSRFKESFNPGSLTLKLVSGSNTLYLTDDSLVNTNSTYIGTSRVYQLYSGSAGSAVNAAGASSYLTPSGSYGIMIPDEGLVILNPRALSLSAGSGGLGAAFNEGASSTSYTVNPNNRLIFSLISSFRLQNLETLSSAYFFTRVKNQEYNYTSNPSIIDANGNLIYTSLTYNPQTFITTVGLYNNTGDLLAIAKLNKPLVKDFTKELLLRIKLDF